MKAFNLTTLEERRTRGDAIETYNLLNGLENVDANQFFKVIREGPSLRTRSHPLKLVTQYARTEKRCNFFSIRAVKIWNKFPRDVILADNLNTFQIQYDNIKANERASTTMSLAP